jgi:endonuclease/exonuclease/phosphatase family metal-dependent hydrolase
VLQTSDAEIPSGFPPTMDVRLTDRIAILARADLKTADLKLSNVRTGSFTTFLSIPTLDGAGPPLESRRGWISVDAKIRGKSFRFITTHLEPGVPAIQVAQANELLAGPANTPLPVVMAGDFNSRADGTGTATYGIVTAAGFTDAWSQAHPGNPGYTYSHPAALSVLGPPLNQRVDLIMTRGGFHALSADVLGASPADRTPSGLWPSDHAGVAAGLGLP